MGNTKANDWVVDLVVKILDYQNFIVSISPGATVDTEAPNIAYLIAIDVQKNLLNDERPLWKM